MLSFTRAIDKALQQQGLKRIAALPDLEQRMRDILASGSGQHALDYLMNHYPLRLEPLAPLYAEFLDRERRRWEPLSRRVQEMLQAAQKV